MFANAINTTICNSNLFAVSGNCIVTNVSEQIHTIPSPTWIEKHEIAWWLSHLDFRRVQDEMLRIHTPDTGGWLLPGLQRWISSDGGAHWITGMAGAGKTYAFSTVIHHLESEIDTNGPHVVVFLYFRYNEGLSVRDIFASIASQLLRSPFGHLFHEDFISLYTQRSKDSPPTTAELLNILRLSLTRLAKFFLALDALDELPKEVRNDLLAELDKCACWHIFITSRPHLELSTGRLPNLKVVHVRWESLAAKNTDVRIFIRNKLDTESRLRDICVGRQDLREEIGETLLRLSCGMFLLSALQIKSLQRVTTMKELREDLKRMPREVEAMHRIMWRRVQEQGQREASLARRAIIWTHYGKPHHSQGTCRRNITAREICDALGVSEDLESYHIDAVPTIAVVLSVCLGFLILETGSDDEQYFKVAHYTTASFIDDNIPEPPAFFSISCMARLRSKGYPNHFVRYTDGNIPTDGSTLPLFAWFAFHKWNVNLTGLKELEASSSIRQTLANCKTTPSVIDISGGSFHLMQANHILVAAGHFDLLPPNLNESEYTSRTSKGWSFLHLAAYSGNTDAVQRLLDMSLFDINSPTDNEFPTTTLALASATPLAIAAQRNHVELCARLLTVNGIHVNAENGCQSPLGLALESGHVEVARLLITHPDIRLELPGGEHPLVKAARYPELVALLLPRIVDVNAICPILKESALAHILLSSFTGSRVRVESLGRIISHPGVNLNLAPVVRSDHHFYKNCDDLQVPEPLKHKSRLAHGRRVLHIAASLLRRDSIQILGLLLGAPGLDINARDGRGRTALFDAISASHCYGPGRPKGFKIDRYINSYALLKRLLQDPRIDVNAVDVEGSTPLMAASDGGQYRAVTSLLYAGADVCMRDKRGRTALICAVDFQSPDTWIARLSCRYTAPMEDLCSVAKLPRSRWRTVQVLLAQSSIDIQCQTSTGWTAPMLAMFHLADALRVDRVILTDEIDRRKLDRADGDSEIHADYIPVSATFREWKEEHNWLINTTLAKTGRQLRLYSYLTVTSLLSHPDTDINHANNRGQTSLHLASAFGHLEVVKIILSQPGVDVRKRGKTGKTALVIAAGRGHADIVRLLLRRFWNDVDEITRAYQHAARYERAEVMAQLEERLARLGDPRGGRYARLEEEARERELADALKSFAQLVDPSEPSLPLQGGQKGLPTSWVRRYMLRFFGK